MKGGHTKGGGKGSTPVISSKGHRPSPGKTPNRGGRTGDTPQTGNLYWALSLPALTRPLRDRLPYPKEKGRKEGRKEKIKIRFLFIYSGTLLFSCNFLYFPLIFPRSLVSVSCLPLNLTCDATPLSTFSLLSLLYPSVLAHRLASYPNGAFGFLPSLPPSPSTLPLPPPEPRPPQTPLRTTPPSLRYSPRVHT